MTLNTFMLEIEYVYFVLTGSKSSGMLPSIPPGVTPLIQPQYIMSQGLPMYQPAFTLNYDDLQYLQRGMHPHMVCSDYKYYEKLCSVHSKKICSELDCLHLQPTGYLDLNYAAAPQTNLAAAGRDALSVPFSSISDGRFPRPDNTTSPVPPTAAAAANASLSQQVRRSKVFYYVFVEIWIFTSEIPCDSVYFDFFGSDNGMI